MFDIGWSEMAIIAVIVLVVLGPKELPHALKTISHWMRAARKLGSEFQSGVNEIVRDAELEDARKQLQGISKQTIEKKIEKAIDPGGDLKKAINEAEDAAKTVSSTVNDPAPAALTEPAPASAPPVTVPAVTAPAEPASAGTTAPPKPTPTVEKPAGRSDAQASIVERN